MGLLDLLTGRRGWPTTPEAEALWQPWVPYGHIHGINAAAGTCALVAVDGRVLWTPPPVEVVRACAGKFAYALALRHRVLPDASVVAWLFAAEWQDGYTWVCWAQESVAVPGEMDPQSRVRTWCIVGQDHEDWFPAVEAADQAAYAEACELAKSGCVRHIPWDWDGEWS